MSDFRPLPLLGNPHVQTVLGAVLDGPPARLQSQPRQVALPDGDRLVVHDSVPPGWQPGDRVAVLLHGLGGSHQSGHVRRVALRLLRRGVRALRMDLRGCGAGAALARRTYNAACSDDVRAVAAAVARWAPGSPLGLAGFSLGGNIVLKLAGEAATDPVPNLERVVAVAPPIDLEGSSALLARPQNRLYDRHFVRSLIEQVRLQSSYFPDLPPVRFPRNTTVRVFDELFTAPRGGFASALDYYRRAAAGPLVPRIRVPTLLVTSRDDPFITIEAFETLVAPPHVVVQILPRGGHLGFLGWDGAGGIRWAERRVVDWLTGPA